ncbi:MAG: dual specificity protein phosphatase family protein [Oligoflexia bacterium]|nr:dual specificity protein phosphatase family protein [Oligoflexia bacterium]
MKIFRLVPLLILLQVTFAMGNEQECTPASPSTLEQVAGHITPIKSFGEVVDGVYRGGHIGNKSNYRMLAHLGVETIINLEYDVSDDAESCRKYKIDCQKYGIVLMKTSDLIFFNYQRLQGAFKAVLQARSLGKKVYIHCNAGVDRTGALSSALMIRERACGKNYNPEQLYTEIRDTLDHYGYHRNAFPFLYHKILSWTKKIPSWICA